MTSERTQKLAATNYWNELMGLRDRQREARKTAVQVVRLSELPLETNPQGLMRWYLHPAITDTILSTLAIYRQELPPGSRSGRLKFQGGQVMFIVAGRGHTTLDGVKHAWEAGDVLNLPTRRDGIIVQHFNDDPAAPAAFLAVEPNLFAATSVDRGCGFELMEPSPDYQPTFLKRAPRRKPPMAEIERTRERERGTIPQTPYEIFIRSRKEFLERQDSGQVVVKPSDREFFLTRQGRLMYHLNPEIHKNTPLQDWRVFSHDLKTQSGKHRHQGGLVIYVITGKGYSVVDGERVDWQAGDLLLLPIKPGGVEHQHFNLQPGADCRWIAFSYMPFFDHVASEFTQTENSPLFNAES